MLETSSTFLRPEGNLQTAPEGRAKLAPKRDLMLWDRCALQHRVPDLRALRMHPVPFGQVSVVLKQVYPKRNKEHTEKGKCIFGEHIL